jgi:hypothetical protein
LQEDVPGPLQLRGGVFQVLEVLEAVGKKKAVPALPPGLGFLAQGFGKTGQTLSMGREERESHG